jgi:hypothetical protein
MEDGMTYLSGLIHVLEASKLIHTVIESALAKATCARSPTLCTDKISQRLSWVLHLRLVQLCQAYVCC